VTPKCLKQFKDAIWNIIPKVLWELHFFFKCEDISKYKWKNKTIYGGVTEIAEHSFRVSNVHQCKFYTTECDFCGTLLILLLFSLYDIILKYDIFLFIF